VVKEQIEKKLSDDDGNNIAVIFIII